MSAGYLCVGGPMDGKMYSAGGRSSFRAAVKKPLLCVDPVIDGDQRTERASDILVYILTPLETTTRNVLVWKPDGQSMIETLTMLVNCYARHAKIMRDAVG